MQIERDELRHLIERREGPCVSVTLPTHRLGPETQQDPIRLKNLLRETEKRLAKTGMRPRDIELLLAPVFELISDRDFWQYRTDGLALYIAENYWRHFDLPFTCNELVVVGERFHIKPIVPLLFQNTRFLVLALSQKATRVFECDRYRIELMTVEGMPKSLEEALAFTEGEKQIQFHSGTPAARGGRRAAIFHGQGAGADDSKIRLLEFCQAIDRSLRKPLAGAPTPLVLAGVKYLQAIYRDANTHPHLVASGLDGNWDEAKLEDLHRLAWELVQPQFDVYRSEAMAHYEQLSGSRDPRSSNSLDQILPAAHQGRVETLFAAELKRQWGHFDPDTGSLVKHDELELGDEDLLDLAAAYTLANGGTVYMVPSDQMPGTATVAAVFRY